MREALILLVLAAVLAIIWYVGRERAKLAAQPKSISLRRLTAEAAQTDQATVANPVTSPEAGAAGRANTGAGLFQGAAASAAGVPYARAADQIQQMTADITNMQRDAERAAERLAKRASNALAAIQVAESARGGAVPGDGSDRCPPSYPVKGDLRTIQYHNPGQSSYDQAVADVCFQNAATAEAVGFSGSSDESRDDPGAIVAEDAVSEQTDRDSRPNRPQATATEDRT